MKERLLSWGTLLCLFVLTCLLLVHALAIFPGVLAIRWFFVTSAVVLGRLDAPAWVQAVGSVAAILAAIGIAMWQRRGDRRRQREEAEAAAAITAVALQNMLPPIVQSLQIAGRLIATVTSAKAFASAKRMHTLFEGLELPTNVQVITLHRVAPKVAVYLAAGFSGYHQLLLALRTIVEEEEPRGEWIAERLCSLKATLEQLHIVFDGSSESLDEIVVNGFRS